MALALADPDFPKSVFPDPARKRTDERAGGGGLGGTTKLPGRKLDLRLSAGACTAAHVLFWRGVHQVNRQVLPRSRRRAPFRGELPSSRGGPNFQEGASCSSLYVVTHRALTCQEPPGTCHGLNSKLNLARVSEHASSGSPLQIHCQHDW